jgi:Zn-dependent protease/CBS domain-containing protein
MAEVPDLRAQVASQSSDSSRKGNFHLVRVGGIDITINYSWLIIFVLVAVSLSVGYFPRYFPGYDYKIYWFIGLVATLLFFASIIIHELSHSLTAVRLGIKIPEITLFLFGGVAHLSEEPSDPKSELKIAVAGPIASFVLAALFWIIAKLIQGTATELIVAVFDYLAWINIILGAFNLVPGYPLDGGRIFRAIVWWRTGSVTKATKWASDIGKGFAWALMILGIFQIFAGSLIGGLWLILIGMFLKGIATSGYQETVMRQFLDHVRVDQVMVEDLVNVGPELPLSEVIDEYFLKYGYGGFPVVQNGTPLGLINLANVKDIPQEERDTKKVSDVMLPLEPSLSILPSETLTDALQKMTRLGVGRLLIMENNVLKGIITKSGLMRYLELKRALQG